MDRRGFFVAPGLSLGSLVLREYAVSDAAVGLLVLG
jgi:hypothetical protein